MIEWVIAIRRHPHLNRQHVRSEKRESPQVTATSPETRGRHAMDGPHRHLRPYEVVPSDIPTLEHIDPPGSTREPAWENLITSAQPADRRTPGLLSRSPIPKHERVQARMARRARRDYYRWLLRLWAVMAAWVGLYVLVCAVIGVFRAALPVIERNSQDRRVNWHDGLWSTGAAGCYVLAALFVLCLAGYVHNYLPGQRR